MCSLFVVILKGLNLQKILWIVPEGRRRAVTFEQQLLTDSENNFLLLLNPWVKFPALPGLRGRCFTLTGALLGDSLWEVSEPRISTKLVIPNWQWLVEQLLQIQCWILSAPEIDSNVQFDRTRDFIERTEIDWTANGCNKENRKTCLKTQKNSRILASWCL